MTRNGLLALVLAGVLITIVIALMAWPRHFEPTLPPFGPGAPHPDGAT
jgi:hypothetical protein